MKQNSFSSVSFSPCAGCSLSAGFEFVFLPQKFKLQPALHSHAAKRVTVTFGLLLQQEPRLHALACALPNSGLPVPVIALSQRLFIAGSIHEVAQVFRRNLSNCMVLAFRARGWAKPGRSPGPTEASGSSVTDFNVSMSGYQ